MAHKATMELGAIGYLIVPAFFAACDATQSVSLTAEDFRFTPDLVRVNGAVPLTLSIYNAGREVHEFDSPVLIYAPSAQISKKE